MGDKTAVIIGAGPAGLTAAYELLTRTDIKPVVLEKSGYMGGISRTVNYKGNRIDIGGHRFFSKSDRVMSWWLKMMPMQAGNGHGDNVMLVRARKSRIYYLRRFFDYPITLSKDTILNLGVFRTAKIGVSYVKSALLPHREETNLEQFFINRFGKELYETFFKSYTEKVWGVPCTQISAEWGAQRIKGLSIWKSVRHAVRKALASKPQAGVAQKDTETSLIEQFLYPKFGPGQMWDEVARRIEQMGGRIIKGLEVDGISAGEGRICGVRGKNLETGVTEVFEGDYYFSTAPIQELLRAFDTPPPANVVEVSEGLMYRDFITVGLLVNGLKIYDETPQGRKLVADNWIYIQEPDVQVGRLQIFNNWSPHLVADASKVWIGMEYFCNDTDALWKMPDDELSAFAQEELARIGIIERADVLDSTVLRMEKTYPAYFGSYDRFGEIREYVDGIENLFLIGRNGMHRYNNQDHSMLTAMMAVDNIVAGTADKSGLWEVNAESEYHEEKGGGA